MRFRNFGKIAGLATLAVVTSVATSKFATRIGLAQSAPLATAPQGPGITVTIADQLPGADVGEPVNTITNIGFTLKPVQVTGHTAKISGNTEIIESRPNMKYLWAVRVLDATDDTSVLFEKFYYDRILEMPANNRLSAAFDDLLDIPLEAGKYQVQLALYGIHPDTGLAGLNDPAWREFTRSTSGTAKVTLGP